MTTSQLELRQKHGRIKARSRYVSFTNRYAKRIAEYEEEYQRHLAMKIRKLVN